MKTLSVKEIVEATGGKLIYGNLNGARGISIDSRTIEKGELFVALKGTRFDGHDFLREALKKGSGAIVSIPPAELAKGKAIIHVKNTLRALQSIAHYLRAKRDVTVVGITGTNGKTTTKEMAASVLETRYRVLKNTGNLNNQIGLPLSLLSLSDDHQVAVLEMGASAPGDIRELCEVASPDYGVITNIGHAHLEGFKALEAVRRTKLEILESVKAAVVNGDDAFLLEGMRGFDGRVIKYGFDSASDVRVGDMELRDRDSSFTLHMDGQSTPVRLKVTGKLNIYNALAAASVGKLFEMGIESVKEGLEGFEGIPMRLEIRELDGATVISDVYNANPASMEEALKELVRLRRERAVAVLGDMLELGSYAEAAHRKLGAWMSDFPVDLFIAVGPLMGLAAEEFSGKSIKAGGAKEARRILLREYRKGDAILIKGSRSMQMERVINDL
jgi:UDP-N-acetylmuramoyl-tripeptide--D-alanyl-D-alanine ligase